MIQFEYKDLGWIIGTAAVVGGAIIWLIRTRLSETFVTKADLGHAIDGADRRLVAIEQRLASIPTHMEVADLNRRLGDVERSVAVVDATVTGTKETVERVEHFVTLLVQHQLNGGPA